jgi:hypothetical protein
MRQMDVRGRMIPAQRELPCDQPNGRPGWVERSGVPPMADTNEGGCPRSTQSGRTLRVPPGGQPVGKPRMARAVRKPGNRGMAAEAEVVLARIAERPAAAAAGKLEQ